jgi:hypothetical protein
MGRHIGQPGSPQQVVLLFTRWQLRGFLSDLSSERCDAIPKGVGLFETAAHHVAPIIRLVAARAAGRIIPYLDLSLDQLFERLRDLPFLIALNTSLQRAGLLVRFPIRLGLTLEYRKILDVVSWPLPFGQGGSSTPSVPGGCR